MEIQKLAVAMVLVFSPLASSFQITSQISMTAKNSATVSEGSGYVIGSAQNSESGLKIYDLFRIRTETDGYTPHSIQLLTYGCINGGFALYTFKYFDVPTKEISAGSNFLMGKPAEIFMQKIIDNGPWFRDVFLGGEKISIKNPQDMCSVPYVNGARAAQYRLEDAVLANAGNRVVKLSYDSRRNKLKISWKIKK